MGPNEDEKAKEGERIDLDEHDRLDEREGQLGPPPPRKPEGPPEADDERPAAA
jgi:hypothetical protein